MRRRPLLSVKRQRRSFFLCPFWRGWCLAVAGIASGAFACFFVTGFVAFGRDTAGFNVFVSIEGGSKVFCKGMGCLLKDYMLFRPVSETFSIRVNGWHCFGGILLIEDMSPSFRDLRLVKEGKRHRAGPWQLDFLRLDSAFGTNLHFF